ncbi:hypothetical protein COU60_01625 [Candidatus Pacearchaeota archaeon CG10_big_fil_rev_8_21_14_0_10_34_76]|nr:MAG: hypothetical protein COU60_01625 [Candidatus Pacearchaeota archaeon CG10_big_fil_rev_8_21_14_0_10_34_76]
MVGEVISVPAELIFELGNLGKWIQAVGLVVIIWIIFQAVTLYFNRKRRKLMEKLDRDLERVEKKLDKILKKKI